MMKYGLILTAPTIKGQMDVAAAADQAGFESVWTTEFFSQHGLVRLAAVATATRNVKLGTAIAYAFMRTPMLAATGAMDIDEISGGRMILGLGTGTKTMNENWYSMPFEDPPAPRVRDAIGLIRAAFEAQDGGGLTYEGKYYQVQIPQYQRRGAPRKDIPVYLAAVNQGMIRAAAATADGLVGHPIFTRQYMTDTVLPLLEGSKCELIPYIITSVNEDPVAARNEARNQVAFYYTTRLYHPVLAGSGWESQAETIAAAFKQGDFRACVAAVPDEMVDAIALTGTPDEVRDKIGQWQDIADHVLFYSPSIGMSPERQMENQQMIIDAFRA
jgi:probable F420-dependent oxidoreductase